MCLARQQDRERRRPGRTILSLDRAPPTLRYASTPFAEVEKYAERRKIPTRSATGNDSPDSASRRASNAWASSTPSRTNSRCPAAGSRDGAYVGMTDVSSSRSLLCCAGVASSEPT